MKTKKIFLPICLLVGHFSPLVAQPITWRPIGSPWGVSARNVAVTNSGDVYIDCGRGDVLRSSDKGKTWKDINLPGNLSTLDKSEYEYFASAPNGDVFAFDASSKALYKLPYDTETWETLKVPSAVNFFNLSPRGDIFIGNWFTGEVYRSEDSGKTFQLFFKQNTANENLKSMYCEDQKVFLFYLVNSANTVLKIIAPNGAVVNKITFPLRLSSNVIKGSSGKYILYSLNDASKKTFIRFVPETGEWAEEPIPGASPTDHLTYIFYNAAGILYLQTSSHKWYASKNDGEHWDPVYFPISDVLKITYSPDKRVSAAITSCWDDYSLYTSGDDWSNADPVDMRLRHAAIYDIQKDWYGAIYVNNCHNYLISRDNGASWAFFKFDQKTSVQRLFFNDHYGFALGKDSLWRISTDQGKTWEPRPEMSSDSVSITHIVTGSEKGVLYGYGGQKRDLYESTDLGKRWKKIGTLPNYYYHVAIHPNGNIYCLGEKIYRSLDKGKTWDDLPFARNFEATPIFLHIAQTGTLIMGFWSPNNTANSAYISNDEGQTIKKIPNPYTQVDHQRFYSNRNGDLFLVDYTGVYVSKDQGSTWVPIGAGLPTIPTIIYSDQDNYLYASLQSGQIYSSKQSVSHPNWVTGRVFREKNDICSLEPDETHLPLFSVRAKGKMEHYRVSDINGNYHLDLPSGGYDVQALAPNALWEPCPPIGVRFEDGTPDSVQLDLGLRPLASCAYLTIEIASERLRRCFSNTYYIQYANEGSSPAKAAKVTITLDSLLEYESADLPLLARQGRAFTFSVGDLPPNTKGAFRLKVKVSCMAPLGFEHCTTADIGPAQPCPVELNPANNAKECRVNTGAFDPNDKQAFVNGRPAPSAIPLKTRIDYLIRFQNTGTDTAFTVVVNDRLSPNLDIQSIKPGLSSHPYRFEILENRLVRFIFSNIALPDSNTNRTASNGFVKFSISPLSGLPNRAEIENTAEIYFDFNEPISTNTVKIQLSSSTPAYKLDCFVSPNPAMDQFEVYLAQSDGKLIEGLFVDMYDAAGHQIRHQQMEGTSTKMACYGLSPGFYWLKMSAYDGRTVVKKIYIY